MEALQQALDGLGINTLGLVSQVVNFVLLMYLLNRFAIGPVLRMLDRRTDRIATSMKQAEEIEQTLLRSKAEYQAEITKARLEAQAIISKAISEGEKLRAAAEQRGRTEADEFLAKARAQIDSDRAAASRELKQQVAELAVATASKAIQGSFASSDQLALVDRILDELDAEQISNGRAAARRN